MEMVVTIIIMLLFSLLFFMIGSRLGLFIYKLVNREKTKPEIKRQIDWKYLMQKYPRFYEFFRGKSPGSTTPDTISSIDKEVTADAEKQKDRKTVSAGEYYAALAEENYRKSIQKRLRQKQFLKRHPETEQMIHSLKCIEGSIQGINSAVRKLSSNLSDLQEKIIELSELAE